MLMTSLEVFGMQSARGFAHVLVWVALLVGSSVAAATAGPILPVDRRHDKKRPRRTARGVLRSNGELSRGAAGIRFAGRCLSACTLYLSVSKSCISRGASLEYHLPYGSSKNGNVRASNFMVRSYQGWVRNWISANGGLRQRMKVMPYEYAARYIPPCSV